MRHCLMTAAALCLLTAPSQAQTAAQQDIVSGLDGVLFCATYYAASTTTVDMAEPAIAGLMQFSETLYARAFLAMLEAGMNEEQVNAVRDSYVGEYRDVILADGAPRIDRASCDATLAETPRP